MRVSIIAMFTLVNELAETSFPSFCMAHDHSPGRQPRPLREEMLLIYLNQAVALYRSIILTEFTIVLKLGAMFWWLIDSVFRLQI